MKLWLDADAAPRDVKEVCFRASERLALETVLVANQRLQLPLGYRHLSAVRVDGGPDVADRYIAEQEVARTAKEIAGSGSTIADVNKLLKGFDQMQSVMKMLGGGKGTKGLRGKARMLKQLSNIDPSQLPS